MRGSGDLLRLQPTEVVPVRSQCQFDTFGECGCGGAAAIARPVELEPDHPVCDGDDFHVATVAGEVRAYFGQGGLHRALRSTQVGMRAQPICAEQQTGNRVARHAVEEDLSAPLADHFDKRSDALQVERVDPIQQLLGRGGHLRIAMRAEHLGKFSDSRKDFVESQVVVTVRPAHGYSVGCDGKRLMLGTGVGSGIGEVGGVYIGALDVVPAGRLTSRCTIAVTSATVASMVSENPRPN